MHVHVNHPDGEAKFWLQPALALATSTGLSSQQIREAQQLVSVHIEEITMPGTHIFPVEVTQVSKHGFWVVSHTLAKSSLSPDVYSDTRCQIKS